MTIAKKILSTLLVLSMLLPMAVSCQNSTPSSDTESNDKLIETDDKATETDGTTAETTSKALNVEGLLLVDNGMSDYVIVRGENAAPAEVTASTELQSYLKKITGAELPIVTDTTAESELEIIVGKTNRETDGEFDREEFGYDGFIIKTTENKLWLVGGETRGTLYSVYEFLEAYLGCRFYTYNYEKIPEISTIQLADIEEDKQIPVFIYRDIDWLLSRQNNFQTKLRINGMYQTPDAAYGGRMEGSINHSMYSLISPDIYYEEHPEYFSAPGYAQPCLSNPDVLSIVTESVRKKLKDYKEINQEIILMNISQEDNSNYCTCEECNRILEEENGYQSGVLLRFVNAVATELKDEFPDVLFNTFAYTYTLDTPTVTKPADNVTMVICSMAACFNHPLRDNVTLDCVAIEGQDWGNPMFPDHLTAWSQISDSIFVWDYTTNYTHYNMHFPNFSVLLDNVKFFAENNVKGVYEQGAFTSDTADFAELRAYIASKILWDPYMSEEEYWEYINDFLEGFYGPGWEYLRQYIDWAEEIPGDKHFSCVLFEPDGILIETYEKVQVNSRDTYPADLTAEMIRNHTEVDWTTYWNWYDSFSGGGEYLVNAAGYFEKALEKAETDEQRTRIDKASLQVDYMESCYLYKQKELGKGTISTILSRFFDANEDLFTEEEKSAFKKEIIKLANAQADEKYAEFNRTLRDRLWNHGITNVTSAKSIADPENLDFSQRPNNW